MKTIDYISVEKVENKSWTRGKGKGERKEKREGREGRGGGRGETGNV